VKIILHFFQTEERRFFLQKAPFLERQVISKVCIEFLHFSANYENALFFSFVKKLISTVVQLGQ
jgi:hypothetical protein